MVSEEQNNDMELASEVVPVPQLQPEIQAPEGDGNNGQINNISRGKPRHRKKALYAALLKQMEFYFSDSNLTKDRFLGDLVKKDPNVDIDVFLRFNKIRTLTTDKNKIVKALRDSKMLKVTEDGTKVYRTTPIVEKQNIDECTVYVQRLPADADHEWLSNLFSEYGPVAYVSIPKFQTNHKIKGFAFIEFETPEGAEKCLKAFRKKGLELPSQTSPTDVLSITTFAEEEKDENGSSDICNNKNIQTESNLDSEKSKSRKKKRKLNAENSEADQSDVSKSKKKKFTENKDKDSTVGPSDSEVDEKHRRKRKNKVTAEELTTDSDSQKNVKESNKKRKQDKIEDHPESCDKNEIDKVEDDEENSEANQSDVSKPKKKKFTENKDKNSTVGPSDSEVDEKKRRKRKNKATAEELTTDSDSQKNAKENNKKKKKDKIENHPESCDKKETNMSEDDEETVECATEEDASEKKKKRKRKRKRNNSNEISGPLDKGLQVMGKKEWKKLRNKYLDLQRSRMKQLKQHMRKARWNQWGERNKMEFEQDEMVTVKKENTSSSLEFTPGVIVKVKLNEACVDPKEFKAELRNSCSNIKYIDIKEGSNEAFIRCDSSETATAISQRTDEGKSFKVLEGEEEKCYWDKIIKDREEKISGKVQVKQRGRNKLLKKAEKVLGIHIKFDEV